MQTLPTTRIEWHRRVLSLAAPIILSNMSVPLVGVVDTAVVGHLPNPIYIGAVALGALIFSFLYWGFGFLRMGTTGFVAQAYGAGDSNEVGTVFMRALILAMVFGVLIIVLQHPIGSVSFWLLEGGVELEATAVDYYQIRVWSAPAALGNYAVLGCLIGLQNTRSALVLQLVLNFTNVILDLLFVLQFGWGVEGVAAASVISEYLALVVGFIIIKSNLARIGSSMQLQGVLNKEKLKALLHVNLNIFIRTLCLVFAFAYFTAEGTKLGEVTLAANAVLLHLQHVLAYGLDGFAHAVEALAGSAYGARNRKSFHSAMFYTTVWALALAGVYTLVYALLGTSIINTLTGIEAVRVSANTYLPWLLVSPIISVWSFQLDGIFIGTTRTVEMRNGMLISLAAYLGAVWALVPVWGNHGLWLSLIIFMILRALTLGLMLPFISRRIADTVQQSPG
ncbi:MAG: MATE family efflux transporter [Arenicellales bacterium]|nr:MATE family efflux transporter [Arenicellales bacterium]